jgi:hypothetical protein
MGVPEMACQSDDRAPVFLDTDFLAGFVWTSNLLVLHQLLTGRIHIPEEVIDEIMRRRMAGSAQARIRHAQDTLKQFLNIGRATRVEIFPGTEEHAEFGRLVSRECLGRALGRGEAAALVHARFKGGVVASNNLSDVVPYCIRNGLTHITTTSLMLSAVSTGALSFDAAAAIWSSMVAEGRRMPYPDFQTAWDEERSV